MTTVLLKKQLCCCLISLPRMTDEHSRICFCTILILVCLSNLSASSYGIRKFNAPDDVGAFQQVVVGPTDGDLFVAGRNFVYRLSDILQVKQVVRTGPLAGDESQCNTDNGCQPKNNDVRILEVDVYNRSLLFCGSAVHGVCSVFSVENLDSVLKISYESRGTQVDASASMVAAFARDVSTPTTDSILFIAHSYSKYSGNVSSDRAQIVRAGWNLSGLISQRKTTQDIGLDEANSNSLHRVSLDIQYLYSFEHENFIYFVTVQQNPILEPLGYETRLVRVCKDDPEFHSYTEVKLVCRQRSLLRMFYNTAVTAAVSQIGTEFAGKLELAAEEWALFVVFGKSEENSVEINKEFGYGLCVYTMKDVKSMFVTAQKDCYSGHGRLLAWIDRTERKCTVVVSLDVVSSELRSPQWLTCSFPSSKNSFLGPNTYNLILIHDYNLCLLIIRH